MHIDIREEAGVLKKTSTFCHDNHTIITDWSNCRTTESNRIDRKKSIGKVISINYDDKCADFILMEYIQKPSETAHDAKLKVFNTSNKKEYLIWSRDFKQGDICKLFK